MEGTHVNAPAAALRLRRRADFLHAAKGKRIHARGLTLQAAPRLALCEAAKAQSRFGFTVSKKCGGAVRRNRIRRRLREALRRLTPLPGEPGHDYVIVARPEALAMAFPALEAELLRAFGRAGRSGISPPLPDKREGQPDRAAGEARSNNLTRRTSKR
ncbi:MAG: ribonuclease P protein component [Beijerinckiaceae bacterium]|nr:ribonuclease P protein component [Beijerinckiaceae bacterium]